MLALRVGGHIAGALTIITCGPSITHGRRVYQKLAVSSRVDLLHAMLAA